MMNKEDLYGDPRPSNQSIQSNQKLISTNSEDWFFEDDYSIYKEIQYGVNIDDSVVYLQDEIKLGHLFELMTRIRLILSHRDEETKNDPITIILNSDGGDVYESLGIIDYIRGLSVPVNIIARGRAMSAAAVILCCGTGVRAASRLTTIMVHEASSEVFGKMADIKANVSHIDELEEEFYKLLAERTKHDVAFWKKACSKDFYMSAAKALELGIIDQII